jgi:hypothetical protein
MKHLQSFLRSLKRTSARSQASDEGMLQRANIRGSNVIPLLARASRQKQRLHDHWLPNETDYAAASRLRDPEHGYEFESWRMW